MEKRKTLTEFFTELIREEQSKKKVPEKMSKEELLSAVKSGKGAELKIGDSDAMMNVYGPEWIKENVDRLFALEEFKYTEEINVLELPTYFANANDAYLAPAKLEEKTKAVSCNTYKVNNNEVEYFGKVVNLYNFTSSPKVYSKEVIEEETSKKGLHVLPPVMNPEEFTQRKEFRFSWNPEEVQDVIMQSKALKDRGDIDKEFTYEEWKKSVFKLIEDNVFDNYKITIPNNYSFFVRGTSIFGKEKAEQ